MISRKSFDLINSRLAWGVFSTRRLARIAVERADWLTPVTCFCASASRSFARAVRQRRSRDPTVAGPPFRIFLVLPERDRRGWLADYRTLMHLVHCLPFRQFLYQMGRVECCFVVSGKAAYVIHVCLVFSRTMHSLFIS